MAALEAGKSAPFFSLPLVAGGNFSLADWLREGPVVLAFFKISCPVCQFAFPYLERIHQAAKGKSVAILGISQNSREDTAKFAREYGITFPIALDDPRSYPASNAYGITNVPTVFYVAEDAKIEISSVGWSKEDLERIARMVGEQAPAAKFEFLRPGEEVPAYRAG